LPPGFLSPTPPFFFSELIHPPSEKSVVEHSGVFLFDLPAIRFMIDYFIVRYESELTIDSPSCSSLSLSSFTARLSFSQSLSKPLFLLSHNKSSEPPKTQAPEKIYSDTTFLSRIFDPTLFGFPYIRGRWAIPGAKPSLSRPSHDNQPLNTCFPKFLPFCPTTSSFKIGDWFLYLIRPLKDSLS